MDQLHEKYENLKNYLKSLGSVAVAFSSGVDSTFLLKVAHDVLGDQAIAVTAASCSFPERELNEAKKFCAENGIQHIVCESEELDIDGFRQNPKNRCYLCKHELFEKVWNIAKENGLNAVAEGSNMDDNGDYRPGLVAVKELGVSSPLRAAELNKQEIRELSKEAGLFTYDKPAYACLATRIAMGNRLTAEKLRSVEQAEGILFEMGFQDFRVRVFHDAARLQMIAADLPRVVEYREEIRRRLAPWFDTVLLDLKGRD